MKYYLKISAMIICIVVFYSEISLAQLKKPISPIKEKLKNEQTIQYKLKHNLMKKNDIKQTQRRINNKNNNITVMENDNYYNDRVYIKFKTQNLTLNTINPKSAKLFTSSFENSKMDALSMKYNVNRIEEAFKVNSKKVSKLLNKNSLAIDPAKNLKNIFTIYFNSSIDVKKVIADYSKFDNVEYVERVPKYKYEAIPNDTYYDSQFYLPLIKADAAWNIHKGQNGDSTIIIGICDSGVEWFHSDLIGNLYQNLAEDADGDGHTIEFIDGQWVLDPGDLDGIDNDGNGYVDDLIGWNFFTGDGSDINNPLASGTNEHGTHVAGISAGMTNNSNGVASISWNVKFLPSKHGSNAGGNSIFNGFDGLIYLAENGADIINCSWGGGGYAQTDQAVIDYVNSLGSMIIAAAGNANSSELFYPASYHGIISVGSIAKNDSKAYYSNYGPAVDIAAPGGDYYQDAMIYSTVPGNTYAYLQGTSMASPVVTGLTALIKSFQPTYSNDKIKEILLANADNIDQQIPNYINKLGFGRIDAYKSLKNLNAKLTNQLKLAKMEDKYIPDQGSFQPGDVFEITDRFANFNPLYGSSNLKYQITALDTNLMVLSGEGTTSVNADADFWLNSLKVMVNSNISTSTAMGSLELKFSSDNGILGDSIFILNINILNFGKLPKAYAYVAWGWGIDPQGPVSLALNKATDLNFLSGEDMSPKYAISGSWFEGKWYCFEDNFDFVTYDTTDGSRTYLGNPGIEIDGLAYDPTTNLLWGVGNNSLYIVNKMDGSLKLVQSLISDVSLINLACNKNGDLFAIDVNYDYMVYINKFNGSITPVAQLNVDYNYSQAMTYDFNTEVMFAATENNNGVPSISYFDFDKGTMNKISNVQNNDEITGLIIPNDYKPYKVDLVSPDFVSNVRDNINFIWMPFNGANSYNLYIADNPNFENYSVYNTENTSLTISDLGIQKVYWAVEAILNNSSEWSGVWTFKHTDMYCLPTNMICDEYISKVEVHNFVNNSGCGITNGYSNYSDKIIDVCKGINYQFKVTNPTPYPEDVAGIWIDYNNDGDLNENEFLSLPSTDGGSNFIGTLNIPETVDTGYVRLRIRIVYSENPDPCSDSRYGETEDYTIHIMMPLTISTAPVTNIKFNSATSGGDIMCDGGSPVTARGVCWSTSHNPTMEDNVTSDGTGIGSYTSNLTGLKSKTNYYVRAYAINSDTTVYGDEIWFKTTQEGNINVTINSDHYYADMMCINEEIVFTPTLDKTGDFTYLWTIDNVNSGNASTFKHKFNSPGQYEVKVRVTGPGNDLGVDWIIVTITDECPVTVLADNFTSCKTSNPTIFPTVFGGKGTYSYNWIPNSDFVDYSVLNATVKNPAYSKEFKIEATDVMTNQKGIDYVYMTVLNSPSVSFDKLYLNIKNSDPVDLTNEDVIKINIYDGKSPFQYKWVNKNGNEIDPTKIYPPLGQSQYFLTVTDANGCKSIEKRLIIFRSNGKENSEDVISGVSGIGYMLTYPNPVTDNISVFADFNTEKPGVLKIYNFLGKELISMAIDNTKIFESQINLSSFTAGVYTIVIETSENTYVKQFIKQ